ncbi:hypothetical protein [Methylorubrum sp. SB2]|uniref:DUF7683 domain-containing protein n=1 Tax=Methylorubrum subtropicum TaxID=3138812 RepID=UPI00313EC7C7
MSVVHRVAGYDKHTEVLEREADIPADLVAEARRLADAPDDPEQAPGAFPLSGSAVARLSAMLGLPMSQERYDWFLEPVES